MTSDALLSEILPRPPAERLKLLEEVWDSVAANPEDVPVPDWHREEIDRRLANPAPLLTRQEFEDRIRETD